MSFLHPEFLYYLLPPLVILFGLLLTQTTAQESYFSEDVMSKLRVSANTLTLKARNGLFFLMALLMVISLSGPVIDEGTVEVKAKSADIMIALDISDSMLAEDMYPNRLKLAKQKALELLKMAPDERVGVIGFAKNSYLVSPLSFDSAAVAFLLRSLDTNSITEKGTNFLSMLEVVANSVNKEGKKYLLILSDGGDQEDFSKEIAYAKEKDIVVFVLGVGTQKGAPIKREDGTFIKQNGEVIISKLNENISALATQTGGVYIQSVNSKEDIETMLKEIHAHSVRKEMKSKEIKRFIPLFYYPLGLAMLILLIATSSMSKRKSVAVPAMFLLFGLMMGGVKAEAGVLDFMELEKAKEAYNAGEYEKAGSIYKEYEAKTKNAETHYNLANTLYKQGKYKEAIASYNKAFFKDPQKQAKNYANLGNSYVKAKEKDGLEKAIKAYENSLKLENDKDVSDNLESVKKALEQKKKQDKKKQDKENKKKNKEDKNKDKKKDSDKDKKSDKKSDKDKQNDSDKEKKKQNEQEKKSDKSKDKKKSDKKSDAQKKKEQEQKKQDEKKKKEKSQAQKEKDKAKELPDQNATVVPQEARKDMKDHMSDEEQKKWMKALNSKHSTYLYQLNKENKFEEKSDEKPW
jgi:Ca-activated chloride channel family protein